MKNFKSRISKRSDKVNSQLIFALDLSLSLYSLNREERKTKREELFQGALSTLKAVEDNVAAVKINYPLLLSLGPDRTSEILDEVDLIKIADFKVADIDNTSRWIGKQAMEMGFDAVIAHPFVGYEKGLSGLFEEVRGHDGGVVLVINMSHPGSKEFITPNAEKLAEFARDRGADGVIAPATRPEEVGEARSRIGPDILLLTPGIGAQGGQPGDAIAAGADYEIVGRAIYQAENPGQSAEKIKEQINRVN